MGLSPRCRAERSWPPAQPPNSPSGTRCHRAAFHGEDRGCRTEQAGCHSCAGVAGALAPRRTGGAGGLKALALRPRAQRLRPSPAPHSHPAPSCLKEEAPAAPPGRRKREGASTRPRLPGGRGRVRLGLLDVLVKAMGLPVRRWEQGFAPGASKLEGLDRRGPSAGMMRVSQALRPPGTPESQTEEALVPATEHAACALWPMRALVEDGGLMLSRPRVGCVSRLQPRGASAALGGSAVCVPHLRMCVHFTCDQAVGPDLSRVGAWGQESPQQPRVPETLDCRDRTGQERFPGSFRVPCVPGPAVSEGLKNAPELPTTSATSLRTRHSVLVKGLGLTQGLECSSGQFQGSTAAPALCAPIASPSLVLGFLGWVGGQEQAGVSLRFKHRHGTLGTCWLVSFREGPVPAVPFSADAAHSMIYRVFVQNIFKTDITWGLLSTSVLRPEFPRMRLCASPLPVACSCRAHRGPYFCKSTHGCSPPSPFFSLRDGPSQTPTYPESSRTLVFKDFHLNVVSVNRCHKETRYKCGTGFEECLAVD
ncbi:unnamed protein product [Rangifer tarandus platyrhynchus]|uniref:Uncharacterized protein n=1 Tax=Rangifer tarandus platyrhynchus TaxID=3082113 RepID=A0ABN8Y831_RANTA|nr:unnamed protein product [Rangifer tarandus platyrhynchus]